MTRKLPINQVDAMHCQTSSTRTTPFSLLFILFSLLLIPPSSAQDCFASDDCMEFILDSKTDNADGTTTYCFNITNHCKKALSNIAFSVPQAATSPSDNSTYQSAGGKNYHIENTTNNPFLSIKFETIGEGIKKGASDVFCFDLLTSLAYNTFDIQAKAANKRYDVTMDLEACLNPEPSCDDLPKIDAGLIGVNDPITGKLSYEVFVDAEDPLVILDEVSPEGGSDDLETIWVKCSSDNCAKNVSQLEEDLDISQVYDAFVANPDAVEIDGTCWEFVSDNDSDDLSLTVDEGVTGTTCFVRYARSAGCNDFTLSSLVKINVNGVTPKSDTDKDVTSNIDFTTYPNPASNQVSILVDSKFAGQKGQLFVSNLVGKTMIATSVEIEENMPIRLSTNALNRGIYNIYINFEGGEKSTVKKLLINK